MTMLPHASDCPIISADSAHGCRYLLLFMFPGVSSEACTFEAWEWEVLFGVEGWRGGMAMAMAKQERGNGFTAVVKQTCVKSTITSRNQNAVSKWVSSAFLSILLEEIVPIVFCHLNHQWLCKTAIETATNLKSKLMRNADDKPVFACLRWDGVGVRNRPLVVR